MVSAAKKVRRIVDTISEARVLWEAVVCKSPDGQRILEGIVKAYAAPSRHYHNVEHIAEMTTLLASYRDELEPWEDAILATLYHDIVYDAKRADNEELSAARCAEELPRLGIPQAQIRAICDMILATRKHKPSSDSATLKLFLDADLAILGAAYDRYDRYADAVRKEYAHVAEADYRAGRISVLCKFLQRPTLYFTDKMQARFGKRARENLTREIDRLKG